MSYQKYQTEALVLSSIERGEADKMYILYTEEFGLVRARATAVRKESSKMRYALQSASRSHVGLVRGKAGWRLAGASLRTGASGVPAEGLRAFMRLARLLERLVISEERNAYLFETMKEAHDMFMKKETDERPIVELLSAARILYALGYLSSESFGEALLTRLRYEEADLAETRAKQKALLDSVNKAIAETQL